MRYFLFKTLVLLLMAAVIAAPLEAQASLTSAGTKDRPAGCHEDGPMVPAPGPSSHQCCQSGHDAAILRPSSAPGLALQVSVLVHFSAGAVALAVANSLSNLEIVSADPPIQPPLRV